MRYLRDSGQQPGRRALRTGTRGYVFGGPPKEQLSGIFGDRFFGPLTLGDVKDGTSNTFAVGEVVGRCNRKDARGWWHVVGTSNAQATTATPLNVYTTCVTSEDEAIKRQYLHPACAQFANNPFRQNNLGWGYKSFHPAGANFLMCDGSVQFINNDINYQIYKAYGGRDDAQPVIE